MAYDDTKWGGNAKIIVDTSTLSVGDTVRVRSMTDSNAVYNKQVVTVGTPIIFETEIYKDYVKICLVQTINDTPTEIGGVYKEVDYGRVLYIDVLDKSSLQGIQAILNAHNESNILNIGDEVTIIVNSADWVMQIANIDSSNHIIDFVSKYIWGKSAMTTGGANKYYTTATALLRAKMQEFYNAIESSQKALIKSRTKPCLKEDAASLWTWDTFSDYVYPPNAYELFGTHGNNSPIALTQFALFVTQANRIKTYNGSSSKWWTCDGDNAGSGAQYFISVGTDGAKNNNGYSASDIGVVPCFRLTADS